MTDEAEAVVRLEEVLLGGPRRYTRLEVSERTGVPTEVGQRLWRALGFPDVGDEEEYFTDGDIEALRLLRQLEDVGIVDTELAITNARAMARQLAQLADWQVGIFVERFLRAAGSEPDDVLDLIPVVMEQIVPAVQQLVVYVWRRQLASAGGRLLVSVGSELTDATLAVGFADLVGYTRLVRGLDETELDRLIDSFESRASDLVATTGGRVVKTIGDEVMFVAPDVRTAIEIGVGLSETLHAGDGPDVRVGIAWGSVLSRLGDIYGSTVNLASRLTTIAKPGSVLLDLAAVEALGDEPSYRVKPIPRVRVRGFGAIEPYVVRRRVDV